MSILLLDYTDEGSPFFIRQIVLKPNNFGVLFIDIAPNSLFSLDLFTTGYTLNL
jgi:hypothetical protein